MKGLVGFLAIIFLITLLSGVIFYNSDETFKTEITDSTMIIEKNDTL